MPDLEYRTAATPEKGGNISGLKVYLCLGAVLLRDVRLRVLPGLQGGWGHQGGNGGTQGHSFSWL